jgi:prophage regulatory protein
VTYFFLQDNYTISLAVLLYRENPVNKTKQLTTVYDALVRVSGKPKSGRFKCPAHQGKGYNLAIRDSTNKVELTCLSQACETRSTVYKQIKAGTFPKQIKLTEHSSAWIASEIQEWANDVVAQRDLVSHQKEKQE